jgi:Chromo (CHRromatin Organisation MOdifier) domain
VFHASLLSPYKETEEHGINYPEPPPDLIEGEEEYEVEDILGSRRHGHGKKLQYLLKWKGYSHTHDSWEPAEQVHAPLLIDKFHRENPESAQVVEINSCKEITPESMPYSSPYNNASSDLGTAILATFFEDVPRIPTTSARPETPVVFRCVGSRPSLHNPWDRGETALPKEDSGSANEGEVHSTYGTPEGSPRLTFSFYLELAEFPPDHRSHGGGGGGGDYQTGGATAAAEIWGKDHNWEIRRVSQAAQTE